MRDLWTSYSVPIAVSGIGLVLVVLLGVAPLIGRNAPAPTVAAPTTTATPVVTAEVPSSALEAVQTTLAQQDGRLDSLSNQVRTLEKGLTRLNLRRAEQEQLVDGLVNLSSDVARTQSEITILNKAVPRINARVSQQSDAAEALPELQQQVAFLEGQMRILNAAVPRLQARIKALQNAN